MLRRCFILSGVFSAMCPASHLAATGVDASFSRQDTAAGIYATHCTPPFENSTYAGGATVGDFNNDGWQDIFFLSGGESDRPDHLYINNGDGTFTDLADQWGVALTHRGKGATVGDFNNDGWLDIYIYTAGPIPGPAEGGHNILYRNNADGTFTDIAAEAGVKDVNPSAEDSWTACFGDFDLDGDLDLFVGGFRFSNPNNNGNRLFRNNGDETFTDITNEIGLFVGVPPVATLSASFADMNGDRYPELLLGGDFEGSGFFGGSRYFQNNNGENFTESADESNVGHEENGMGQCLGDVDNDGDLDWYVTSIYFPQISWTGNKLYVNQGNHNYTEVAESAGVDDGGYGWGATAIDVNHDGWLDILETNGDAGGTFGDEQTYLWINNSDGTYTEQAEAAGIAHFDRGRTLINFDYDNDGDQDIIVTTNNGPLHLYRNDLNLVQGNTNWLRVFLDTQDWAGLAPNGYGATVVVTAGPQQFMRSINGGVSFLGISELSAHFGLADITTIDELRIDWPDGTSTIIDSVEINQTITVNPDGIVQDGGPCPADLNEDNSVGTADLLQLLGVWGKCPECAEDLDDSGSVDVADLLELLASWGKCA